LAALMAVAGCSTMTKDSGAHGAEARQSADQTGTEARQSADQTRSSAAPAKLGGVGSGGSAFRMRDFEEITLKNGLRILALQDNTLPSLSLNLLVRSGSSSDPAEHLGLAAFVSELMERGTAQRDSQTLARDLAALGASLSASAGRDSMGLEIDGLSFHQDQLLAIFAEVLLRPRFADDEIERVRKQMIASVEKRLDSPEDTASVAFDRLLFRDHPYGRAVSGTRSTLSAIRKRQINGFYLRHFRPSQSILAVVGRFEPAYIKKVSAALEGWGDRPVGRPAIPPVPVFSGRSIQLFDNPSGVQAQIRMGQFGIKRNDPDFIPLRVANTILGGAFYSRLNARIRKELGLTYGISSSIEANLVAGSIEISTFTKNSSVGQTITEALGLLEAFVQSGVTEDELRMAKGYLAGVFPQAIETSERLAGNLLALRLHEIPDDYLRTYLRELAAVNRDAVNRAIRKHFTPNTLKILVYGKASEITDQLVQIGPIDLRSTDELR
jgi:zinc protease